MSVTLDHVTRVVDGMETIRDVSLTLERGTLTVLLGPTLSGKTSIMRLLAGLDKPTTGRVLVDGKDVTGFDVRKRSVAMVYQQFINYPSLTVYENIASPLRVQRRPREEIDKLVAGLARWPSAAILSDEIYGRLTYDGLAHRTLLAYPEIRDRLILLDGWSKTYAMTGWRLGYSVWPKPWREMARKLAVNSYSCVNSATQFAGIAALKGPQDSVAAMRAEFDRRRKAVTAGLNRLPGVRAATPKGAFYAFPNVARTGWKAKPLASALLQEAGVATIGGPDFGVYGEGYLRLSYANSLENIERALERMQDFLSRPARAASNW